MPAGFQVYDDQGRLQASSDMFAYHVRRTGQTATVSRIGGNTTRSTLLVSKSGLSPNAFVATQCNGYAASLIGMDTNGNWNFATNAPIGTVFNWYVFDQAANIPATATFGLEVRNDAGQITFSAAHRPMSVVSMLSYGGQPGYYGDYYSDPGVITLPGRSLASFNTAWAGHRFTENIQPDTDGTGGGQVGPIIGPGGGESGGNSGWWQWDNNGKVYGGMALDAGQTMQTCEISWDDVHSRFNQGDPPPDFVTPLKLFVVDVTGVPIGRTWF